MTLRGVLRLAMLAAALPAGAADLLVERALEAASRADPEATVRAAAQRALAELLAATSRALALDEPQGKAGDDAARAALKDSLARHLRRQGFAVVGSRDPAGYRLKPSVLELEISVAGSRTTIAVKASVVAVDSQGKMAAMVEGGARLRATGGTIGSAQLAARALDATALTLSEDLAARLR